MFTKSLYKISKEELGKIISDLDSKFPESLTKNKAEDEVYVIVDSILVTVFYDIMMVMSTCDNDTIGWKNNSALNKGSNKKARSS